MDDHLNAVLETGNPDDPDDKDSGLKLGEDDGLITSQDGQSIYRVVQMNTGDGDDQSIVAHALPPGTQVAQAVLHSPFASGTSTGDGSGDSTFYIPSTSGVGLSAENGDAVVSSQGGQFYVMMAPHDVLQSPRSGAVRVQSNTRVNRDDRRRTTHNEVERRRRDKINNWIVALSKLIPECQNDNMTASNNVSKSGILSKACEFIQDIKHTNSRLAETTKEYDRLQTENVTLLQQLDQCKEEITSLKRILEQNGIDTSGITESTRLSDINNSLN